MALIALSIQAIVIYRQRHKRSRVNATIPKRGIVFEDFDYKDWDASLVNACKFAFNYTFYRFGLEISMIMMAVVAWVRMDLIGTLTLIWLIVFVCISRNASRRIWPLFLIYLAVLLPLQYQFCSKQVAEYPWSHWLSNSIQNENFVLWLDLASYRIHPNPYNTIADFFLLLIVSCQQYAFYAEYHNFYSIGDNESVYKTKDYNIAANNPHYDFITHQRSFVDVLKLAIFNYGHWATLVMVLIAGLGGVSLFALGYIVLAFWLLWQGNALYIRKRYEVTLRRWKILLIYIVLTMFCKVILQVVGCAFIHLLKEYHLCYIRQLFSIVCVNKALDGTENYYFDGRWFLIIYFLL
ncbi:unnamed protein product [Anisakis simplex]|uniref:PIEZO domain-containing protein n=1 Tax=Anisakis simplex TaxID=6269 RepID=A0A0M3J2Y6_ANISI|nr:unnamed protein product [Anisakis simplex]